MEPRNVAPTPGRAYVSTVKTARSPAVDPARPSPTPPTQGGVVLPMITPPSSTRLPSPGDATKRHVWTTPRDPADVASPPSRSAGPSSPLVARSVGEDSGSDGSIRFWNNGAPRRPTRDEDEATQLALMDQMYNRIQTLNAKLDRENEESQQYKARDVEHQVEMREKATLDALQRYSTRAVEESENFGVVGAHAPLVISHDTNAATVNRTFRPHQPRSTSPPQLAAVLPRDQLELCAALGKNAELRIRTREIERQAEQASTVLEKTQRQIKMTERRIANRDEKLRALLKEKLHWENEMKELREQVVEEKMRQVDLMRRLETTKRETSAQLDAMAQTIRDVEEDNATLRHHLADTTHQLNLQTKRMEDYVKQSREEKEKLTECIVEARGKFRDCKDGEAVAMKAQRDQAINHLKAEYELKIARHHEEKHKLRDKVKDLEVSIRLMQKDRSLSPLELSLRKATILGSKDHAGTTEAELIEAHVRIKELEALLEHSQEFQKRQESIIKVSEVTISRLIQEREVAALDTLANQRLGGKRGGSSFPGECDITPLSLGTLSSSSGSAMSLSPRQLVAPVRAAYKSPSARRFSGESHRQQRVEPSPPSARPRAVDQPVRPIAPPPRSLGIMTPERRHSRERLATGTGDENVVLPSTRQPALSVDRPSSPSKEELMEEIMEMQAALKVALDAQRPTEPGAQEAIQEEVAGPGSAGDRDKMDSPAGFAQGDQIQMSRALPVSSIAATTECREGSSVLKEDTQPVRVSSGEALSAVDGHELVEAVTVSDGDSILDRNETDNKKSQESEVVEASRNEPTRQNSACPQVCSTPSPELSPSNVERVDDTRQDVVSQILGTPEDHMVEQEQSCTKSGEAFVAEDSVPKDELASAGEANVEKADREPAFDRSEEEMVIESSREPDEVSIALEEILREVECTADARGDVESFSNDDCGGSEKEENQRDCEATLNEDSDARDGQIESVKSKEDDAVVTECAESFGDLDEKKTREAEVAVNSLQDQAASSDAERVEHDSSEQVGDSVLAPIDNISTVDSPENAACHPNVSVALNGSDLNQSESHGDTSGVTTKTLSDVDDLASLRAMAGEVVTNAERTALEKLSSRQERSESTASVDSKLSLVSVIVREQFSGDAAAVVAAQFVEEVINASLQAVGGAASLVPDVCTTHECPQPASPSTQDIFLVLCSKEAVASSVDLQDQNMQQCANTGGDENNDQPGDIDPSASTAQNDQAGSQQGTALDVSSASAIESQENDRIEDAETESKIDEDNANEAAVTPMASSCQEETAARRIIRVAATSLVIAASNQVVRTFVATFTLEKMAAVDAHRSLEAVCVDGASDEPPCYQVSVPLEREERDSAMGVVADEAPTPDQAAISRDPLPSDVLMTRLQKQPMVPLDTAAEVSPPDSAAEPTPHVEASITSAPSMQQVDQELWESAQLAATASADIEPLTFTELLAPVEPSEIDSVVSDLVTLVLASVPQERLPGCLTDETKLALGSPQTPGDQNSSGMASSSVFESAETGVAMEEESVATFDDSYEEVGLQPEWVADTTDTSDLPQTAGNEDAPTERDPADIDPPRCPSAFEMTDKSDLLDETPMDDILVNDQASSTTPGDGSIPKGDITLVAAGVLLLPPGDALYEETLRFSVATIATAFVADAARTGIDRVLMLEEQPRPSTATDWDSGKLIYAFASAEVDRWVNECIEAQVDQRLVALIRSSENDESPVERSVESTELDGMPTQVDATEEPIDASSTELFDAFDCQDYVLPDAAACPAEEEIDGPDFESACPESASPSSSSDLHKLEKLEPTCDCSTPEAIVDDELHELVGDILHRLEEEVDMDNAAAEVDDSILTDGVEDKTLSLPRTSSSLPLDRVIKLDGDGDVTSVNADSLTVETAAPAEPSVLMGCVERCVQDLIQLVEVVKEIVDAVESTPRSYETPVVVRPQFVAADDQGASDHIVSRCASATELDAGDEVTTSDSTAVPQGPAVLAMSTPLTENGGDMVAQDVPVCKRDDAQPFDDEVNTLLTTPLPQGPEDVEMLLAPPRPQDPQDITRLSQNGGDNGISAVVVEVTEEDQRGEKFEGLEEVETSIHCADTPPDDSAFPQNGVDPASSRAEDAEIHEDNAGSGLDCASQFPAETKTEVVSVPLLAVKSKTESWQELVGSSPMPDVPRIACERSSVPVVKSPAMGFPDSSRYASVIVREMIRDPTLLAYDVKHEQTQPFALLDENILTIDQHARHMQHDENDMARLTSVTEAPRSKHAAAIEGVLVTKRKRMDHEAHRKSIAYRIIPAFNYEPVLIKFQWSDFVVATPIRIMSSGSQLNLLQILNGGQAPRTDSAPAGEPLKKPQILTSPIKKMKLLLKKGFKLPCSTYVIISVFNRPLEDGNENVRIQIYDSERVEEFQYDFHEDHLREYVEEWTGSDDEARAFFARLEFRREQGSIIIKMPDKIRKSPPPTPDPNDNAAHAAEPKVVSPTPMAQLLTNLATTQPLELPPEPHYRLSPNAPASPQRQPPPLVHQLTAPHRLESFAFISRIEEDNESVASSVHPRSP